MAKEGESTRGMVGFHMSAAQRGKHVARKVPRPTRGWRRGTFMGVAALVVTAGSLYGVGSTILTSGAVTTASTPLAPTSVKVAQVGQLPDLRVSWVPSTLGTPATGAVVQLYGVANEQLQNAHYEGQISCEANCTTAVFRQLQFGTLYAILVWPTNSLGTGTPAASAALSAMNTCPVGACVAMDATNLIGTANHADSGLQLSLLPIDNDEQDAAALDTTMYRGSPGYNADGSFNWSTWNVAVAAGSPTTLVLSNLWAAYSGGSPTTPWSNWSAYSTWVTNTVTSIVASGEQVTYWEPYNEPGGTGYYSAANFATVTPALLLQQFLVTYDAIKAVDPGAAVIGPSLAIWEDYPNEYGSGLQEPDMVTFLNYAVANNIQLAAISWHEIDDSLGPNPSEDSLLPINLEDHVAEAQALIAARPSLGNPKIFINEYGMPEVQLIPGWDVSYLSALTEAGVSSADRACWGSACTNASLDALLDPSGTTPWNDYFVRQVYAAMSGSMVTVNTNSDTVTGLGSYNATTGQFVGLVGRAVGCTQDPWCAETWPKSTDAAPIAVNIDVAVPWSSGQVNIALTDIPGATIGATPAPSPVDSVATITPTSKGNGIINLSIPSFVDGDAYGITVTQASSVTSTTKKS
jgi:hypothetical protein